MDGDHECMLLLKCSILKIQLQCIILLTVLNFTLSIGQSSWAACMSPGFHPGLITLCPSVNNYNFAVFDLWNGMDQYMDPYSTKLKNCIYGMQK